MTDIEEGRVAKTMEGVGHGSPPTAATHANSIAPWLKAVRQGRSAPVLLMHPDRSTSERSLRRLATAWLCHSPLESSSDDACGHCSACLAMADNVYPDILWLRPHPSMATPDALVTWMKTTAWEANEPGWQHRIAAVRALRDRLHRPPSFPRGTRRVVALMEWDRQGGAEPVQALLKLIEEPPEGLLLISTVTNIARVPQTWRSRCTVIRLNDGHEESRPNDNSTNDGSANGVSTNDDSTTDRVGMWIHAEWSGARWKECLSTVGSRPSVSPLHGLIGQIVSASSTQHQWSAEGRARVVRAAANAMRQLRLQLHPQLIALVLLEALASARASRENL